jgi:hypothetical protein
VSNEQPIWDQLPNEPDAAYNRFLVYRNLGPSRSLQSAWDAQKVSNRGKSGRVSGQWQKDSADYQWVERANAWDGYQLQQAGAATVHNWINILSGIAGKTLEAINEGVKPDNWSGVIQSAQVLGAHISPEAVNALAELYRSSGNGGEGNGGGSGE